MAIKVTVTFETVVDGDAAGEDLSGLIQQVARALQGGRRSLDTSSDDVPASPLELGQNPSGWTFRDFEEFWELISPGAKKILIELAKKPEGRPDQELGAVLQMDGQKIGGYLASVGRRKSQFGKQEPIYKKDATSNWQYVLAPEVAGYIQVLSNVTAP